MASDWLAIVGICIVGAVSPGPSLAVVVKHTLTKGCTAGITAAITHGLTVGLYALICISGLALLVRSSSFGFATLQWLGAGYLIWIGYKGLSRTEPKSKETRDKESITDASLNSVGSDNMNFWHSSFANSDYRLAARDGFLIVFLNPKIAIFFIALFSQFVGPETSSWLRAAYVLTAFVIDAGWYVLVAWLLSRPAWLSRLNENAVWIERFFGAVLLVLAAKLIFDLIVSQPV